MTDLEMIKRDIVVLKGWASRDTYSTFEGIKEAATRMSERIEEAERVIEIKNEVNRLLISENDRLKAKLAAAKPITCRECAKRTQGCTSRMYFETQFVRVEYQEVDFCSNAVRKEATDANNSDK